MKFYNKHKQRGMGLITGFFALVAFLFIIVVFLKLFPVYMDNMIVDSALDKVKNTPNVVMHSDREIRNSFYATLSQENAEVFPESDLKKHVFIVRDDQGMEVTVQYKKIVPLVSNVSFLMEFENITSIDAP